MAQQKSGQDVTAGKGRRDDIGRTGIFPATGPYPKGDLDVLTPDDINRGHDPGEPDEDDRDSDALGG